MFQIALTIACSIACWMASSLAYAAAHPKPEPTEAFRGKRVIELAPIAPVVIDLPDDSQYGIGPDIEAVLARKLTESGRYIAVTPQGATIAGERHALSTRPGFIWTGSAESAARLAIDVQSFTFTTGIGGNRFTYGFNARIPRISNEFPLRDAEFEQNWFDRTFDVLGAVPFESTAGLDLAEGFNLSVVLAGARLRYAQYQAHLGIQLSVQKASGEQELRDVGVDATGFYFDVAGQYLGYAAGLSIARRDALTRVLARAEEAIFDAVDRSVRFAPLAARIDALLPTGEILLGTGQDAQLARGVRFRSVSDPARVVEVVSSQFEGSIARSVSGSFPQVGERFIEMASTMPSGAPLASGVSRVGGTTHALTTNGVPQLSDQITLPRVDLPKAQGIDTVLPALDATDILKFLALPFRIWKGLQYDRALKDRPDQPVQDPEWERAGSASSVPVGAHAWSANQQSESWARNIGLSTAGRAQSRFTGEGVVVALIDSGVDYNHPVIHGSTVAAGPDGGVGFDAIGGDSRAYDDGYHGTEIASLVLAVAPGATILPIKFVNPWGATRSAALLAAFDAAIEGGAQVIVTGWATRRSSEALRLGLERARARGIVVVAAAGDRGDDLARDPAYPAGYRAQFDNLLTVASTTAAGSLLTLYGRYSNFGAGLVDIAAPGENLRVARPLRGLARVSSSGHAAALVAGALAREMHWGRKERGEPVDNAISARERLLSQAQSLPALAGKVAQSRWLRVLH